MNITRTLRTTVLMISVAAAGMAADDGYAKFSRQKDLAREGERAENRGAFAAAAKAYRRSGLYAVDNRTRAGLLLRQAECHVLAGDPYEAFTAYRTLLEAYPLYVPYDRVLPRLRQLAGDFERGAGSWFGFSNRSKAIEVYELILQETPVGSGAMQDSLNLGGLLAATGRNAEAIPVYRDALKRFPGDPLAPQLRLELGRLLAEDSRTGDGDGQVARQAVRELQAFAKARPDDPRKADAEFLVGLVSERRADALYDLASFYLRPAHKREPAARRYLSDLTRDFPGTTAAAQAEVLLASLGPAPATPEFPEPAVAGTAVTPAGPEAVEAAPAAPPATAPAPKEKRPARRLLEGILPKASADEGQPRTFRTLEERENVQKWLVPLGDVNDLRSGGGSQ